MREIEQNQRRQYEKSAEIYEFETYGELPHMGFYLRFRAQAIAEVIRGRLGGRSLIRILEVGCGTGVNLTFLCREFPHATIVGIDLASAMLRHTNEKIHGFASRANLCQASCFDLPFGDGSVDVLLSTRFIHQFPHQLKRLAHQEFRRVVQPEGVVIVEFYARAYARLHYAIPRRMAWWRKSYAPQDAPATAYFSHYPTRAEVRDIVGSNFESVLVRPVMLRLLYRMLGEPIMWLITRALQYDPFRISYSEYLVVSGGLTREAPLRD